MYDINSLLNAIIRSDLSQATYKSKSKTIGPYGDSGMYRRKVYWAGYNERITLFLSLLFGLNDLLFFVIDSDGSGVDHLGRVLDQKLDLAHTVKFFDGTSSEGTSDLHTVRDDWWGDDLNIWWWNEIAKIDRYEHKEHVPKKTGTYLVVWNFLEDFVICWLIEQAHILELVPGFSFRPLLFGLLSTSGGGFRLGVLRLLWCLCHF